ncbi:hypothetical protein [Saccharibacillus alkalitolerans]|uniref:Uncharacterized protein n=1 Tax=Saccharibacillus alkalitolerans TaxID=2705290 RepID=A0ABX0F8R5_9BACL|nr:hypothetical protein [Saccharibacillus alkalitolerans]NGZ77267.1 hypothetical protein [Saccharibacillus alkalitolerans]
MSGEMTGRIAINAAALLIVTAIWFVLGSRDLYARQIVPLYYAGGVLLIAAVLFVLNRWGMKASLPFTLASIGLALVLFIAISRPVAANPLYRDVLGHYYERFQADTLLRFPAYMRAEHNYVTVIRALEDAGVRANTIEGGIGEGSGPEQVDGDRTKAQVVYLINGDTYAIFDWKDRRVLGVRPAASLLEEAEAELKADQAVDSRHLKAYLILFRLTSGGSQGFYVYARDGELKLVAR